MTNNEDKADKPKKTKRNTNKPPSTNKNWINWFIPLLLTLIAVGTLIFYPKPDPKSISTHDTAKYGSQSAMEQKTSFKPEEVANSLVSTFFNGSDEARTEQIRALKKTITELHNDNDENAEKALSALLTNNIYGSIESLTALSNEQSDLRRAAKTWVNIGNIQNLTSAEQALQAYQKASEIDPGSREAWSRQGHVYRQLKQFDLAEAAFKKVQSASDQSNEDKASSLANFGLLNQSKGNFKAAEDAFTEALDIYTKEGDKPGIARTSESLASLYKSWNVFDRAERYYLKALENYSQVNDFQGMTTLHSALGNLYQQKKQLQKAQHHYEQALQISLDNNYKDKIDSLYNTLALLAEQNGDLQQSKEFLDKSQQYKDSQGNTGESAIQLSNLAILNRNKRNFALAEEYHKKAIEIYKTNNNANGVISQKINLGFLYKTWGKKQLACDTWQESLFMLKSYKSNRADRVEKLLQANCR